MIESDITTIMSGIIRNSGQNLHPSPQEYRLMTSDSSRVAEEELPSDLQSLSWLTAVDVPRLQQLASGRMDFGGPSALLQPTGPVAAGMLTVGAPGTIGHVPGSVPPQGMLGLSSIGSHGAAMGQYPMGAQPSPSLQDQSQLYAAPSQPPFTLAQGTHQGPPAGMYSVSFGTQPPFPQPRLPPHSAQDLHPKHYPKPIYSYSCLIAMALKNSKTGSLPVSEIYSFMKEHFPYFKTAPDGWKNSVRHNLSLNKCFEKVENKMSGSSRKGCLWALNLARIDKMEEEMHKWKRKDLAAIHRSMANPEELDKLISDRPESCRRLGEPGDPEVPVLGRVVAAATAQGRLTTARLPPQPVMTLSLQSIPLQHQLQPRAGLAPGSPAPAQTPPLHALPDVSCSPLPTHHAVSRGPMDFLNVVGDMSTEVDALDPSIMDFALQGNIWDEMKDDGFSLDTLGAFSDSPLQLSDCDLGTSGLTPVSSGSDQSFSDLQVTSLYATYAASGDNGPSSSAQYLGTPGNKPIALL
ncbi:forkhead box protein N4 [Dromiciops gliroides]|uniref:forkhead box protein N4 n=1 Tax=Dromiciops gliroides TaxID=33562 RepID=UPI001CC509FF|nr:forkhead box protein N4 [Dromiciops gliroides]